MDEHEDEKSANYARGHLKRFLGVGRPRNALRLIMEARTAGASEVRQIGEWSAEDVRAEDAQKMEDTVLADCEEQQASVDARLTWMVQDGAGGERRSTTKDIKRRFARLGTDGEPVLTGDATSLVVQAQGLLRDALREAASDRRAIMSAVGQMVSNLSESMALQSAQLGQARADVEMERQRRMEAEDALAALGGQADPTAERVAQTQENIVNTLVPALAKVLTERRAPDVTPH